ncbi:extracellular solute-binding protein [Paenibacillus alkalitolerans]|uniref:extracellular solute-binding protein n=1 Tax=Paenibacillus alkalitolerans TaxID=2799335 RepID=UPI0018F6798E|nr:extracellular solute-binding protein [Paenibacillus alkalitolerans]
MKRKNFTIALMAALILSLILSGCTGGTKPETTPKPTEENTKDPTPDQSEEPEVRGNITVSTYDNNQVPAEEGTYTDNRWTRWMNENGPVDVTFVPIPRHESQQKFSTLFASGDAPDLILEFDNGFRNQLWSQKQLMPLDDLIEEHSTEYKALLEKFPELRKLGTKPDGKLYDIGRVIPTQVLGTVVIRKDWLDKLELKVPETIDELFDAAYAFAHEDPDNNGKKDTFGINMSQNAHYFIDGMFGNDMFVIEDGQLVRPFDRIQPAADFKKKLFENGIVDRDFLTDKNGQKAQQDFASGKLGIYIAYKTDVKKNYETLKKNDPGAQIIPIAFPVSPFGAFAPDFNPPIQNVGAVNANAKDPAAVIKYIDFMVKPSTAEYFQYGEEGVHYMKDANGCPSPIDAEKNKNEINYNVYYKMPISTYVLKECLIDGVSPDSDNAFDQEWISISKKMDELYLDPNRTMPGFTHAKLRPSLEKELSMTFEDGWNTMHDLMLRAVVSGKSYTTDQAMKDLIDAWEKSGGKKLEEWYANWYQENKDKWIFMKDLYLMKVNED